MYKYIFTNSYKNKFSFILFLTQQSKFIIKYLIKFNLKK